MMLTILLAAAALQDQAARTSQRELFVAFRFDSQRVVATLKSDLNVQLPQLARDPVPTPIAEYGYPIFDLPSDLQKLVPPAVRDGDRWTVHAGPGQTFDATAERIVLGEGGCSHLLGVLLKVDDRDARAFAGVRADYYAAAPEPRSADIAASKLGELPAALTPGMRARIETTLARLMTSELPAVRHEAGDDLRRTASDTGEHADWARGVLAAHEALARGAGTVKYDAQVYRLTPDGVPSIFVRAMWHAAGRQAFALAVWMRSDTGEIIWKNTRPASWIGMYEFHRGVDLEQLGLVFNIVDSNGDGWAEVVFTQLGYEGIGVSLLDVRASFQPIGAGYSYGC